MLLLRLAGWIPHLVLAGTSSLLLYTVGRPVRTADVWLHHKLGEAHAAQGPWLDADPILYTATAPPTAAAWLSDLALHSVQLTAGFQGLRVAHVLAVAAILALGYSLLRRASGSAALASLGTTLLIVLGGYRFLQLRPHLVTIFCVLLLYRVLLESRQAPSWRRIAVGALLLGVWANAHAGFVLGPILLAAGLAGVVLEGVAGPSHGRPAALARARGLGLALAAGLLATFLNPDGAGPHLAYFRAGSDSPALAMVVDEWRPFPLLGPLRGGLPPSLLNFGIGWLLFVSAPTLSVASFWPWRRGQSSPADPALVGVACAGVLASAMAVRFQWLGIFAILLALQLGRTALARPRARLAAAGSALALLPLWIQVGGWPRLSEGVPRSIEGYALPYSTGHYFGHATWFLRDTGLEGHLFNRYVIGNFLGYWLAPRLQPFFGGSLNVPPDVAEAHFALNERRGLGEMSFEETLDHYEVDAFLGIGLPSPASDARPQVYTTTHLDGTEGWIPIFRNLRSSIWLRANTRNEANLDRVIAYYRAAGIPFDPGSGFDPGLALDTSPDWAVQHGLAPSTYSRMLASVRVGGPIAMRRLASVYATLGLYERAVELDRQFLARREALDVRRRLIWCLLHLGRGEEALAAAERFERSAPERSLARILADAARAYGEASSDAERAELISGLRMLTAADANILFANVLDAAPR
jgi:tetratricopeptide (TPR) repeat protein